MRKHYKSHLGCKICTYKATKHSKLRFHIDNVHGTKYPCGQCEYFGSSKSLKSHIQIEHELVRLQCELCDYEAKYRRELKNHVLYCHSDKQYSCMKCDYKATSKSLLNDHMKMDHFF